MTELEELWQRASDSEFGIAVVADNMRQCMNQLYEVRKSHPELRSIKICEMGDSLWLVKDTVARLDYAGATR